MSDRLDITRRGERGFTATQEAAVVRYIFTHLRGQKRTTVQIAQDTGVEGRTLRAIINKNDGGPFVLAGGDDGLTIAEYQEDADRMTNRMAAHANSELQRVARRRAYPELPRRQPVLLFIPEFADW